MAEAEAYETTTFRLPRQPDERFEHSRAGTPGDVKARHRIAVPVGEPTAALRPADHGKPAHAERVQPGALLARGKVEIGFGPEPWPVILRTVELRGAHPVLPGKLAGVADAHAALFRAVDKEQAAKRPEGLSAKILFPFLVEHDDPAAECRRLRCGDKAGKPRADNQNIAIHEMLSPRIPSGPPRTDTQRPPQPSDWLQKLLRVRQGQFKRQAASPDDGMPGEPKSISRSA